MQHWLISDEKMRVIDALLRFGLIKVDNKRLLPLKSGGTTDIYINLRNARNNPEAIAFLAKVFANPLRRLGISRFVEIPDSVSCLAGPLAIETNIPYLTIRDQAKAGRVSKAKTVGNPNFGESVCIIDDVITDGASKLEPYRECRVLGLNLVPLVVLVDRQQGWPKKFAELGIKMDVWPGMTLHDVRRHLIKRGIMERCSKESEEKNPLIVALDGKGWEEILPLADQLRTTGCILKVNDLVFGEGIENIVPNLQVYGRVMVDLKCYDIPNTVANTCKRLRPFNPWAVTVHASGGEKMIKAAVDALEGTDTMVLAVTVLTSIDQSICEEVFTRQPMDQVKKLAEIAHRAGARGIVCSPKETSAIREMFPSMKIITPGIRSFGADVHDQERVDTPAGAMVGGSNYLVMGRQILEADDPHGEVMGILSEIKVIS